MNFLTAALLASVTALFTLTAFGADAAPSEKEVIRALNKSATLQAVQAGVKKDFGMVKCTKFELSEPTFGEGPVKARSICTYQDKWGEESGILIDVEGNFYEGMSFIPNNINFVFAG